MRTSSATNPLRRLMALATLAGVAMAPVCRGQEAAGATLTVTVRDTLTHAPIAAAVVQLSGPSLPQLDLRTTGRGVATKRDLKTGTYRLHVQQIGYVARDTTVDLTGSVSVVINLTRTAVPLGPMTVSMGAGVYGTVGSSPDFRPLASVTVEVVGSATIATTDSSGQYVLSVPRGGTHLVRVSRRGFRARLQWVDIPPDKYAELSVLLDSNPRQSPDEEALWKEFGERTRWRRMTAALVSSDELRQYGHGALSLALAAAPSTVKQGLRIGASTCVFVDGRPKPNWPLDAYSIDEVEAVELYGKDADETHTLARAWPPNAPCGTAESLSRTRSTTDQRSIATWAVIWLRP